MSTIIFATQNPHKAREVEAMLGTDYHIEPLTTYDITEELPENGQTLEDNAVEKAAYVFDRLRKPCFAEDTGLEIDALNGEPGVYTARYAGPQRDNIANMNKVLTLMEGKINRKARFRTVIAYKPKGGNVHVFEGIVEGHIATEMCGDLGFGYDPIFIPEGYDKTFAQLGDDVKNAISHRARAIAELKLYLALQINS